MLNGYNLTKIIKCDYIEEGTSLVCLSETVDRQCDLPDNIEVGEYYKDWNLEKYVLKSTITIIYGINWVDL